MRKKLYNLKFILINNIYKKLHKWCFSSKHDNDCNGCIFKNFKQCPLSKLCNKLILKL